MKSERCINYIENTKEQLDEIIEHYNFLEREETLLLNNPTLAQFLRGLNTPEAIRNYFAIEKHNLEEIVRLFGDDEDQLYFELKVHY